MTVGAMERVEAEKQRSPPRPDYVKVNVDGAFDEATGTARSLWGVVIRNSKGEVIQGKGALSEATNALNPEAIAMIICRNFKALVDSLRLLEFLIISVVYIMNI
ncbi:hypothetical protein SLE2022_143350 [Rubroshorea leprosula]